MGEPGRPSPGAFVPLARPLGPLWPVPITTARQGGTPSRHTSWTVRSGHHVHLAARRTTSVRFLPPHDSPTSFAHQRRTRRLAAGLVALVGFDTLACALSEPLSDRLRILTEILPISVPQTAGALAALTGLGLLILARGVRRGQRRAWAVCMALLSASVVLHLLKGLNLGDGAVAAAVAGYLWVRREHFRAFADLPSLRRGVPALALCALTTLGAGTLGIELSFIFDRLRGHRATGVSVGHAFQATAGRLVGVRAVALPHHFAAFFDPAISAASTAIALGAIVLVFRPVVAHFYGRDEALERVARARAIVARHGGGTLDYFALRTDKRFFFRGDSLVAYAVYGTFCLVSPDPIGPAEERGTIWQDFRAFVDNQGWALGVLAGGDTWRDLYRSGGMREFYIGDEAVVELATFSHEGGRMKSVRQAVGRVVRHGYTVSFHDPANLEDALRDQLLEIATSSRRGNGERGFSMTLGRLFDPNDEGLLLAIVHAPPAPGQALGRPVAFCHYVPAPQIGGYSLDVMRRARGSYPNGLIDFAVVETIRHLAEQGAHGLALNFAVMRAVLAGESGDGLLHRTWARTTRRLASTSQAESLWRFNAKYHPRWLPRYVYCDAPGHAFSAALAIARAESLWELPLIGRLLAPRPGAGRLARPGLVTSAPWRAAQRWPRNLGAAGSRTRRLLQGKESCDAALRVPRRRSLQARQGPERA